MRLLKNLENPARDVRSLLDRGYPSTSVIRFVSNHYKLSISERHLITRAVLPSSIAQKRRYKRIGCNEIKGLEVIIDGYNVLITTESVLDQEIVLCDDGFIRDIKGVFGKYKKTEATDIALAEILTLLSKSSPSIVLFLFDSQVSKSRELARYVKEKLAQFGLEGNTETLKSVDQKLKTCKAVVATSDGGIIDSVDSIVDIPKCIMKNLRTTPLQIK
ncbi:MAG: DUF434 domain-containing protein [Methanocellales archaeon]|nr:DUF434 domain-containing protein [Methanocellales archaeon]